MPLKILKGLGKENAPLLLRYGAIPHMWRWGLAFAENCTPEKFAANSRANLDLALYSLRALQEIGAENGIEYDRATKGVLKIYRSKEALDNAQRACDMLAKGGLRYERIDVARTVDIEPALAGTSSTLAGGGAISTDAQGGVRT